MHITYDILTLTTFQYSENLFYNSECVEGDFLEKWRNYASFN